MTRFTRSFHATPPAPFGTTDRRYDLRKPRYLVLYEKDGELVYTELQPGPNESPKTILAAIGVNVEDALIDFVG